MSSDQLLDDTAGNTTTGKRDLIIDAASRAFFEHGYAGASIEQIAAAANVSKVTIYSHFGGKSALLSAAVEHECEQMRGYLSLEPLEQGSLRDRLMALGEAMVAFLSRPKMIQFERRIAAETERDPEIGRAFLESGPRRMMAGLTALLESFVESGELTISEPALAAEQFVSMCKGFGDLERRFGVKTAPELDRARIEGAVAVFLAAYGNRKN